MPWISERFYANPLYGRALERARAADEGRVWSEEYSEMDQRRAPNPFPNHDSASPQSDGGHWVTIDHRHVLIHEGQNGQEHPHRTLGRPLPSFGQASIYSDSFEGKKTANGELFRQKDYTAALLPRSRWKAVPLGTRVEITSHGHSIVVEINDRGAGDENPESARTLDLSRAAASALTGRQISNDHDSRSVGLIPLDQIRVVPANTPLGPRRP